MAGDPVWKQPRPLRDPKPPQRKRWGMRAKSPKRVAQQTTRDEVRLQALERASWRCEAKYVVTEVKCDFYGGRMLEVDEIIPRSQWNEGYLVLDNVQVLCPAHHDWKTTHPKEAHEKGLRKWSHERKDVR